MTLDALLAELRRRGIKLRIDGDILGYCPKEAVDQALLAELKAHKPRLMALLCDLPARNTPPLSGPTAAPSAPTTTARGPSARASKPASPPAAAPGQPATKPAPGGTRPPMPRRTPRPAEAPAVDPLDPQALWLATVAALNDELPGHVLQGCREAIVRWVVEDEGAVPLPDRPEKSDPGPAPEDVARLLEKAEAAGWPSVKLTPWATLLGGREGWQKFARYVGQRQPTAAADETRREHFRLALAALNANRPL